MQALKAIFYKAYFNVALLFDQNIPKDDRILNFFKTILTFGPIAFILEQLNIWFFTHQGFVVGALILIIFNMILGAIVHARKKDFDWKILLKRTNEMTIILILSYLTLEVIMSVAGSSPVVTVFRITIQVTTLLYPGSKILKNIFIFSKGEYPPEWLMKKIYNFQANGDLNALLKSKTSPNDNTH